MALPTMCGVPIEIKRNLTILSFLKIFSFELQGHELLQMHLKRFKQLLPCVEGP